MKNKWEWVGGFLVIKEPLRPSEAIMLRREIEKQLTAICQEEECQATAS